MQATNLVPNPNLIDRAARPLIHLCFRSKSGPSGEITVPPDKMQGGNKHEKTPGFSGSHSPEPN
jgi:hypothetical protein